MGDSPRPGVSAGESSVSPSPAPPPPYLPLRGWAVSVYAGARDPAPSLLVSPQSAEGSPDMPAFVSVRTWDRLQSEREKWKDFESFCTTEWEEDEPNVADWWRNTPQYYTQGWPLQIFGSRERIRAISSLTTKGFLEIIRQDEGGHLAMGGLTANNMVAATFRRVCKELKVDVDLRKFQTYDMLRGYFIFEIFREIIRDGFVPGTVNFLDSMEDLWLEWPPQNDPYGLQLHKLKPCVAVRLSYPLLNSRAVLTCLNLSAGWKRLEAIGNVPECINREPVPRVRTHRRNVTWQRLKESGQKAILDEAVKVGFKVDHWFYHAPSSPDSALVPGEPHPSDEQQPRAPDIETILDSVFPHTVPPPPSPIPSGNQISLTPRSPDPGYPLGDPSTVEHAENHNSQSSDRTLFETPEESPSSPPQSPPPGPSPAPAPLEPSSPVPSSEEEDVSAQDIKAKAAAILVRLATAAGPETEKEAVAAAPAEAPAVLGGPAVEEEWVVMEEPAAPVPVCDAATQPAVAETPAEDAPPAQDVPSAHDEAKAKRKAKEQRRKERRRVEKAQAEEMKSRLEEEKARKREEQRREAEEKLNREAERKLQADRQKWAEDTRCRQQEVRDRKKEARRREEDARRPQKEVRPAPPAPPPVAPTNPAGRTHGALASPAESSSVTETAPPHPLPNEGNAAPQVQTTLPWRQLARRARRLVRRETRRIVARDVRRLVAAELDRVRPRDSSGNVSRVDRMVLDRLIEESSWNRRSGYNNRDCGRGRSASLSSNNPSWMEWGVGRFGPRGNVAGKLEAWEACQPPSAPSSKTSSPNAYRHPAATNKGRSILSQDLDFAVVHLFVPFDSADDAPLSFGGVALRTA
ncbi:hypothetical protein B0T14DRAFT_570309 [Immersiella caudata]|uniref:Uncharacterized protein n=1 Tax=Immersiella caudata TaxID=314043 RepID=A0AA39WFD5_9PEZI|nr:hypothetical protein B0T14DRAFT_570309 [Immersiella caudata]